MIEPSVLQWGHVFSDVETPFDEKYAFVGQMLQWGHVFSDVETFFGVSIMIGLFIASMGPRLFRRGNCTTSNNLFLKNNQH